MADYEAMSIALQKGKAPDVLRMVKEALDEGIKAEVVMQEGLIKGMNVIAKKFKNNEVFVPEVLIAARAMKIGMEPISPILEKEGVEPIGKIIIGTVKGDLHDIGKNLVAMMLRGAGFEVIDIGIDQSPENFVAKAKEHNIKMIGLCALLTTTMPSMKDTIEKFKEAGLDDTVKIAIGGAPVTQEYADEISADGFANDAASAIDLFKSFI